MAFSFGGIVNVVIPVGPYSSPRLAATEATEGVLEGEDPTGDVTEKNMEQLMVASDATAVPAPDDKDSSTITIFNENSEVCCFIFLLSLA